MMSNTQWETLTDHWGILADRWGKKLASKFRQRKWTEIKNKFGKELGLSDDELRDFGRWLVNEWLPQQSQAPATESPPPKAQESIPEEVVPNLHWKEHDRTYWYDKSRDLYVVHLPSRKFPLAIPGDKWCAIRDAYSNWSGSPASVNELSRKFGMARRTVLELLRCMGTTHDSAPWTDEELQVEDEDSLVEDLLRRKEERILVKAERDNWDRIKADADKWRTFERQILSKLESAIPEPYHPPKLKVPDSNRRFVAVVSPSDFHHGKYSDEFEVSEEDNRKLQRLRLIKSAERVLGDVTKHGRPERIILGIGSDFFNIDNDKKTTTDGTPQDVDGNPAEILITGCQLMVEYIDLLRQVAPVSAVLMSGNHDRLLGVTLLLYLGAWYRDIPDVQIQQKSAASRQYIEYGQNLLCFHHADTVPKTADLARLAAVEKPREWGRTNHKMVFTGHLHSIKMEEDRGFTRFQLPSLSGTDRWHSRHGYVGSRKVLAAVLVDRDDGVFGTLYAEGD